MRIPYSIILLVLLVLPGGAQADDLSDLMPESVGALKRIQLVTGPQAQAEVDRLHGKPLPAEASAVARYSRPDDVGTKRPAEVWVSRVASGKEARRQTGLMVHMMYENPKSPFRNPRRLDHQGMAVYRFEGMGQTHFIWFKEDLVYWVSSAAEDESIMLESFCQ